MTKRKGNFDLFTDYGYYTPGPSGAVALLLWFIVGTLLGTAITVAVSQLAGGAVATEYLMLISYPLMFIFPMFAASFKSRRNAFFETGYALDSKHWGSIGAAGCAAMAMASTLCCSYMTDIASAVLPPLPESLANSLDALTGGDLWVDFICVSVFAPLFEEWLCRGEILRGLLNWKRKDGSRGMSPVWAIIISSAVFALIHGNPWQAIPAFIIGCLFGFVYYRTGSLKLTMLMHFTNNTFALVMSRIDAFAEMETWVDVLGPKMYGVIFAAAGMLLLLILRQFGRIPVLGGRSNCDEQTVPPLTK